MNEKEEKITSNSFKGISKDTNAPINSQQTKTSTSIKEDGKQGPLDVEKVPKNKPAGNLSREQELKKEIEKNEKLTQEQQLSFLKRGKRRMEKKIRKCIECGKIIPINRAKNSRIITCSKKCSNKRATTPSQKRLR